MNQTTLLHRIIRPDWWVQADVVSSQAFRPSSEDRKLLSVYDGDQITPASAYNHYSSDPNKLPPTGALSVTVAECDSTGLPAIPDPDNFPEHILIDFRNFGTNQIKRKSEALRDSAIARGWLFRP